MTITDFTPVSAAVGGVLIGLAANALLLLNGQVAGISGILGGLVTPSDGDRGWRLAFVVGLALGGIGFAVLAPGAFDSTGAIDAGGSNLHGFGRVALAGLLVGFGTRLGNGCTSGHGVCGISRGSTRSIVATMVFMAAAIATVFVARHVLRLG